MNRFTSSRHTSHPKDRFSDVEQWKSMVGRTIASTRLEIFAKYRKLGGITGEKTLEKKKNKRGRNRVDWSETGSIFQYRERQISPVDFFLSRIILVSNAYSLSSYRFDATSCFVRPVDPIVSDRIMKKRKKKKMEENEEKK